MADTPKKRCQIVRVVIHHQARVMVKRFRDGESARSIAVFYGLSRTGVEELIRAYGWLRNGQKAQAR